MVHLNILISILAYVWIGYCAISHIQIEAKKKNEGISFNEQKIGYIVQVLFYWLIASVILYVI
jgi:hypothetical protein